MAPDYEPLMSMTCEPVLVEPGDEVCVRVSAHRPKGPSLSIVVTSVAGAEVARGNAASLKEDPSQYETRIEIARELDAGFYAVQVVENDVVECMDWVFVATLSERKQLASLDEALEHREKAAVQFKAGKVSAASDSMLAAATHYEHAGEHELAARVRDERQWLMEHTPDIVVLGGGLHLNYSDTASHVVHLRPNIRLLSPQSTQWLHSGLVYQTASALPVNPSVPPSRRLRESRRIIEKIRDLERGRKVDHIFNLHLGPMPAIVVCLMSFHDFIVATQTTSGDTRFAILHSKLLAQLENLSVEVARKALLPPGRRRLNPALGTSVILAHRNLNRYIYQQGQVSPHISSDESWTTLCFISAFIWGNRLVQDNIQRLLTSAGPDDDIKIVATGAPY